MPQKTPFLSLNQWDPSDPPLRRDFNADNLAVDTALSQQAGLLGGVRRDTDDAVHGLYVLSLRQAFESKPVTQRTTLFYDGFLDKTMADAALTTAQLVPGERKLYGRDLRFVGGLNYDQSVQVKASQSQAQSYRCAAAARLFSVSFELQSSVSASRSLSVAVYGLDAQNRPAGAALATGLLSLTTSQNGFTYRPASVTLPAPLDVPSGSFAVVFSCPGWDSGDYVTLRAGSGLGVHAGNWEPSGANWQSRAYPIYLDVAAVLTGAPAQYVTREILLPRQCARATVFLTQNTGSVGYVVPRIALYDGAPAYVPLTRDPSLDVRVDAALTETTWEITVPKAAKARLLLYFDPRQGDAYATQYGCFVGS